ncbi:guanyl-nucleotide exchange factor (Sec7) [Purpureocillium lavendulum]|uniref:Guanyl-nucleotide exchange factor (Sec7) n=1 Tax=Purpureocillium lavendulum TaxID=1247861 RepID=A0AB34FUP9_9HYPO|nr:guanyl-nucleotide exchange factor (Sec7) [Purpureocillium lavendulum]
MSSLRAEDSRLHAYTTSPVNGQDVDIYNGTKSPEPFRFPAAAMKTPHARLAVLSGLAAVASASALPPGSVPLRCATICGPVVELSALCSTPPRRLAKRQSVEAPPMAKRDWSDSSGSSNEDGEHSAPEKRAFIITFVAPPPTSLPFEPTATTRDARPPSMWAQQAVPSRISHVHPVIVAPTTTTETTTAATYLHHEQYVSVPPAATRSTMAPFTTTGLALGANGPPQDTTMHPAVVVPSVIGGVPPSAPWIATSTSSFAAPPTTTTTMEPIPIPTPTSSTTTMTATTTTSADAATTGVGDDMDMRQDGDNGDGDGDGDDDGDGLTPEEACVCKNTSFDVPLVSGLCADCIMQGGDMHSNMNLIMTTCGFPTVGYTPARDSVAQNVDVKASRPPPGPRKGTAGGGASRPRVGAADAAAAVVALALVAAIFA